MLEQSRVGQKISTAVTAAFLAVVTWTGPTTPRDPKCGEDRDDTPAGYSEPAKKSGEGVDTTSTPKKETGSGCK